MLKKSTAPLGEEWLATLGEVDLKLSGWSTTLMEVIGTETTLMDDKRGTGTSSSGTTNDASIPISSSVDAV